VADQQAQGQVGQADGEDYGKRGDDQDDKRGHAYH